MAGTLAVPNIFTTPPAQNKRPGADLDLNFTTIQTYVNAREITQGLIANRPSAGTAGAFYFATDVPVGVGTLYGDNGLAWVQLTFPPPDVEPAALFFAIPLWLPQI